MKKLLLTFIFLLLAAGTSVYATPFLLNEGDRVATNSITIEGVDYEIVDQSQEKDQWNSAFGGYEADPEALSDDSYYNFTGYYLGTVVGDNDSADDMSKLIAYYLDLDSYNVNYVKSEGEDGKEPGVIINGTVEKEDDEFISGEWILADENNTTNFYIVKAADEYALYYIDLAFLKGYWTTAHLLNGGENIPAISHLSAATTAAPVPEPATLFLFGVGLLGLAGFRRKLEH